VENGEVKARGIFWDPTLDGGGTCSRKGKRKGAVRHSLKALRKGVEQRRKPVDLLFGSQLGGGKLYGKKGREGKYEKARGTTKKFRLGLERLIHAFRSLFHKEKKWRSYTREANLPNRAHKSRWREKKKKGREGGRGGGSNGKERDVQQRARPSRGPCALGLERRCPCCTGL